MRDAGWNLNTLPPQHPAAQHMSHIGISAHVVSPSVNNTTQSQMNATAASPVQQLQDDRRRAAAAVVVAEHDRMMAVEREREREREREMEREREKPLPLLDRLRQHQQQRYYPSTAVSFGFFFCLFYI